MVTDRIRGTNAFVVFEDNTQLKSFAEELDKMYDKLNNVLDIVRNKINGDYIKDDVIAIHRVKGTKLMLTFVRIENQHNPYIFIYNVGIQDLPTNLFSFEDLQAVTSEKSLEILSYEFQRIEKNQMQMEVMSPDRKKIFCEEINQTDKLWNNARGLSRIESDKTNDELEM